ncbi:Crp/Fnr family transcriptional regulator [Neorhizobium alkalisoli]|jgi:CRP-like cAMP-binding protein|uniref:CRP-like cAMP-binding protein n=1 Tax=Neorhizobium alkalisoli TaxID=528178 RepID=A0A561QVR2_9HYPH|nr:Crp/Fnr family transcriptional regulator [Neorhizobium alkalisoli]TWF54457.1 CRP-like cAMP-binding protein [Neorhizobium alkalisoli]
MTYAQADMASAVPANRLLRLLAASDYLRIEPHLEFLDLPQAMQLSGPDDIDEYCYFPTSGIGSTILVSRKGTQSETCLFGFEGMSPASALLGSDRNPNRVIMQVAGQGVRISRPKLYEIVQGSDTMRRLFFRWAHVVSTQISFTALANANHTIDQRLARWILMCHDRADGDEIKLTHEFLSIMLSVRRPSVTTALHELEGMRFIYSHRGTVIVRNRQALEGFAGDAYGGSEKEYLRLLGPLVRGSVSARAVGL